jgi:transcription termination factor NusB
MRDKDSPGKKGTSGTSLSLEPELRQKLKQKAKEHRLTVTGYIRTLVLGGPDYSEDVERWIAERSKKIGVSRHTVIERSILFVMMYERKTKKEAV